jgi:hypothetical protein
MFTKGINLLFITGEAYDISVWPNQTPKYTQGRTRLEKINKRVYLWNY